MSNSLRVVSVERPELSPFLMPMKFRTEVVYFMTPTDRPNAPVLASNEYWIEPSNIKGWLEDGVFTVVSPLDAETVAEIEISEDQERWLEWMQQHNLSIIRLES